MMTNTQSTKIPNHITTTLQGPIHKSPPPPTTSLSRMEVNTTKTKTYGANKININDTNQDDTDDVEKQLLREELVRLKQTVQETELKCQKYLGDRKKLRSSINHLKIQLNDVKTKLNFANVMYEDSVKKLKDATVEWKSFQQDLLTAVKVANDVKIEAQENAERLTVKNRKLNERIPILEAQIRSLQEQLTKASLTGTQITCNDPDVQNNKAVDLSPRQESTVKDEVIIKSEDEKSDHCCGVSGIKSEIKDSVPSNGSDVVDGSNPTKIDKKPDDTGSNASMLPPKVIPRRSVSVQPFCVSVAPRSPLRSISIDPVPSIASNTPINQFNQGSKSRDPLSYSSSRKSIAKYVDFRTASQMSVKNLVMSLENASKSVPPPPRSSDT